MRAATLFSFAALIALTGVICAQPSTRFPTPILGNSSTGNATSGSVAGNFTVANASEQSILAGESYLIGRLGEGYYSSYANYTGGFYSSSTNQTSLFFSYRIPYPNGSTTSGAFGIAAVRTLGITITLDKGNGVVEYYGPSQPYVIRVPAYNATSTASLYGVANGTASISAAEGNATTASALTGYSVVWAVTGGSPLANHTAYPNRVYPGLYIDVENGSVVGEYTYNPMIVAPQQGMSRATLGTFWLFPLNASAPASVTAASAQGNATQQGAVQFTQSEAFGIITAGAAGIIISAVAAVIAYRALSRRHK